MKSREALRLINHWRKTYTLDQIAVAVGARNRQVVHAWVRKGVPDWRLQGVERAVETLGSLPISTKRGQNG